LNEVFIPAVANFKFTQSFDEFWLVTASHRGRGSFSYGNNCV